MEKSQAIMRSLVERIRAIQGADNGSVAPAVMQNGEDTPMVGNELDFQALLKLDLMSFVERCFMELQPTQQLSLASHLEVMAAKLADTLLGKGPKRLIINLPPRSLKSITVSVGAVAWLLGHDPSNQIICASYGQDLADKLARDTRTIMASSFYRSIFPEAVLSIAKQSVNDFITTKQGFRMATSVGGVLTGRGADIIIIDDPLKPDEALSETRTKRRQRLVRQHPPESAQ